MANEREAVILGETRTAASSMREGLYLIFKARDAFNELGGTPDFEGSGKLFAADGSGQLIPFNDFLGLFTALGDLETNHAASWSAFRAALGRARG